MIPSSTIFERGGRVARQGGQVGEHRRERQGPCSSHAVSSRSAILRSRRPVARMPAVASCRFGGMPFALRAPLQHHHAPVERHQRRAQVVGQDGDQLIGRHHGVPARRRPGRCTRPARRGAAAARSSPPPLPETARPRRETARPGPSSIWSVPRRSRHVERDRHHRAHAQRPGDAAQFVGLLVQLPRPEAVSGLKYPRPCRRWTRPGGPGPRRPVGAPGGGAEARMRAACHAPAGTRHTAALSAWSVSVTSWLAWSRAWRTVAGSIANKPSSMRSCRASEWGGRETVSIVYLCVVCERVAQGAAPPWVGRPKQDG